MITNVNNKISLIKLIRERFQCGLLDAKYLLDAILDSATTTPEADRCPSEGQLSPQYVVSYIKAPADIFGNRVHGFNFSSRIIAEEEVIKQAKQFTDSTYKVWKLVTEIKADKVSIKRA